MWNDRYSAAGLFNRVVFDPVSMTALAVVGSGLSAMGTLAGGANAAAMGRMQQQAEEFQATQDTMNSAAEIAAAGRKSQDTLLKASLTASTARANAAAGGVTTTTGSPLTNEAQITSRGQYAAALDMWNGQNAASGDLNKAAAAHYSGLVDKIGGQMQQEASYFTAAGTLASGGASAYKIYGMGSTGGSSWGPGVGATGPVPYG